MAHREVFVSRNCPYPQISLPRTNLRRPFFTGVILFLIAFLALAGPARATDDCNCGDANPVRVITVDGSDFVANQLDPPNHTYWKTRGEGYLGDGVRGMGSAVVNDCICRYTWNGDAANTVKVLGGLRSYLRQQYSTAQSKGQKLMVIAHSWGAVLSYLALLQESYSSDGPIVLDRYVTLSNPMGVANASGYGGRVLDEIIWIMTERQVVGALPLRNPRVQHKFTANWVNIWAWGDPASGPIENAGWTEGAAEHLENLEVDGSFYTSDNPDDCASGTSDPADQTRCRKRDVATLYLWHDITSLNQADPDSVAPLANAGIIKGFPSTETQERVKLIYNDLRDSIKYEIEELIP